MKIKDLLENPYNEVLYFFELKDGLLILTLTHIIFVSDCILCGNFGQAL